MIKNKQTNPKTKQNKEQTNKQNQKQKFKKYPSKHSTEACRKQARTKPQGNADHSGALRKSKGEDPEHSWSSKQP